MQSMKKYYLEIYLRQQRSLKPCPHTVSLKMVPLFSHVQPDGDLLRTELVHRLQERSRLEVDT